MRTETVFEFSDLCPKFLELYLAHRRFSINICWVDRDRPEIKRTWILDLVLSPLGFANNFTEEGMGLRD